MTTEQLSDLQELIDKFHPSSISEAELKRRCRKAIEECVQPNDTFIDNDQTNVYYDVERGLIVANMSNELAKDVSKSISRIRDIQNKHK